MNRIERACMALRYHPQLRGAQWLWDAARPHYERALALVSRGGLERTINGTDRVLMLPQLRNMAETHEPAVWRHLMAQARPGDVIADVGAHVGIYAIALAQRIGPTGRVLAFEPDPATNTMLRAQIALNRVAERVEVAQVAVGDSDGAVAFATARGFESHVLPAHGLGSTQVRSVRLDTAARGRRVNMLKIDVEGYERHVLLGAHALLRDAARRPRVIYIEAHPYAWPALGTTGEQILALLADAGYCACDVADRPLARITEYGELVAWAN